MDVTEQALVVSRGQYRLNAAITPGPGTPVVLMHGFPDNTHLPARVAELVLAG